MFTFCFIWQLTAIVNNRNTSGFLSNCSFAQLQITGLTSDTINDIGGCAVEMVIEIIVLLYYCITCTL